MEKYPILCSDPIFKSIFSKYPNILRKFIYDVTGKYYKNISLGMNEIPINRYKEKFKRCDFIINTDSNTIINIELNNNYSKTVLIKNTSYIFEIFSNYASSGDNYNDKLEILQININNFSRFNKSILDYQILNESYGYVYFRGLKIWDLDIEKCKLVYYNSTRKRKSIKWGALFSCTSIEEMRPILKELLNKKEVYLFMEGLKKITKYYSIMDEDEALRLDDKIRRSLRNEGYEEGMEKGLEQGIEKGLEQGIEKGKEQGIEQTTIDMIKSMLENKLNYNTILKVSGKSLDKIKEIEKSMNR